MQINTLQLNGTRKKRKTIGRGGKKGTYSGKGMKGQKARSGAKINPLFEGGRSTLIDHLKKNRGFQAFRPKKNVFNLSDLEKKFKDGDVVSVDSLLKVGLLSPRKSQAGVKILGRGKLSKKLKAKKEIFLSKSAQKIIEQEN